MTEPATLLHPAADRADRHGVPISRDVRIQARLSLRIAILQHANSTIMEGGARGIMDSLTSRG